MRLDDEFIKAIDIWRTAQPDIPPRTKAIERLAAIGLADQMMRAARRRERKTLKTICQAAKLRALSGNL
jgi:hypothetical protein